MNRIDGEDYSVFGKPRIPLSGMSPQYTQEEADEVRAAFREESSSLRIPQIRIPRGPDGFIHTSVMSALDLQDLPVNTPKCLVHSSRSRWNLIRIVTLPFQTGRLQRAHR